jgi:hypothetical protein
MRASTGRRGIGTRRKLLFAFIALALVYLAYARHAGLAFAMGTPTQEMDWNNDGTVSMQEIAQSWYAVTVRTSKQGARTCQSYYRRGHESEDALRVACKTTFAAQDKQ